MLKRVLKEEEEKKIFKKKKFFKFKLNKQKRMTPWKKRKKLYKLFPIKRKFFFIKPEFYKILTLIFFKKKKMYKNIFLNHQKSNYSCRFKRNLFKKKIKKKFVFSEIFKKNIFHKDLQSYHSYNNYFPVYNSSQFLTRKFKFFLNLFFLRDI